MQKPLITAALVTAMIVIPTWYLAIQARAEMQTYCNSVYVWNGTSTINNIRTHLIMNSLEISQEAINCHQMGYLNGGMS